MLELGFCQVVSGSLDPCSGPLEFRAGHFSGSWDIWQQCGPIWDSRFSLLENARRAGLPLATCTSPDLPSPGITLAQHETPVLLPETKKKIRRQRYRVLIRSCKVSLFLGGFFWFYLSAHLQVIPFVICCLPETNILWSPKKKLCNNFGRRSQETFVVRAQRILKDRA